RVRMPGWATRDLPLQPRGERPAATTLLEQRLPSVPDEGAVHAERLPAHLALGARSGPRGRATSTRQATLCDDLATTHGRTRLRHAQALDGFDALPDPHAGQREYGDEPARAGLQPQESDEHPGDQKDDEGDQVGRRLSALLASRDCTNQPSRELRQSLASVHLVARRVLTQPRPQAAARERQLWSYRSIGGASGKQSPAKAPWHRNPR